MDRDELIRFAHEPGEPHRQALLALASRADGALPVAREWLRRWRPRRMVVDVPACGCAAGRCAVCN
jgi:hypothetical protein